ncbi:FAD-dependent oxidoreductase [Dokdonella sp.]|uniref:FAD-dependent oxidoreductase n=1 Tax=Dokdonella sp. TaxID=2291710 RepID=UPI003C57647D
MSERTFPFLRLARALPAEISIPIRVADFHEINADFVGGEAADQASRCIDCGNPYCSWGCPLGNRIPQWLKLVKEDRIEDAATLMHETNPLPEICGRVCPQDRLCEGICTLEEDFGAVTIGAIERSVTDEAIKRGWRPPEATATTDKRVAIIGAGPAGLSAADRLARAGVQADVFDRHEEIGGLLTFGIPAFKLEKDIVRTRRRVLEDQGVKFHVGTEIGRDVAFEKLVDDYDAVFMATGAYTAVDARLPGQQRAGVVVALPFLIANARQQMGTATAADVLPDLGGKRVVVLGGGDTAMDCVRTSVRLGAERVTCVYRRDEANMPGSRKEVKNAREEGVIFRFLAQPLAIVGGDVVDGVEIAETRLVQDGDGRARCEIVESSSQTIPADIVILSFGFLASPPDWCARFGIEPDDNGRLRVGGDTRLPLQTGHPKVFAGGDNVRGADLVVRAVLDGREAARSILSQLNVVA